MASDAQREAAPDSEQEFVREAADFGEGATGYGRLDRYGHLEDYYRGEHRVPLLDRARLWLHDEHVPFAENFCDTVVDTLAHRLHVEGFSVVDDEDASDWLTGTLWGRSRLDELQGVVHTETLKLGDGFLLVDFDEATQLPRLHFNHPSKIKPVYDDDGGEMRYAVKRWATSEVGPSNPAGRLVWRVNIYFPDHIEKWFAADKNGELWERWAEPDAPWPTPWLAGSGEPLGIPVFHFAHRPQSGKFGRSKLLGAIPYQRILNKQSIDLFHVMDAQGWQWPYITGVDEDTAIRLAIGDVITTRNADSKVGQLPAADPRPALEALEGTLRRLSAATHTPLHDLIEGTPPSGEALKTAEAGLVHEARDCQTTFGNRYEDATRLAWRLAGAFSSRPDVPAYDPDAEISTVWDDPETRNEQTEAETYTAHHLLGVSKATLLRKLGYDPDEEVKLRKAEQAEDSATMRAALGAGLDDDGPPPPGDE